MSNHVTPNHSYIYGVPFRYQLSTTCDFVQAEHYWDTNTAEAVWQIQMKSTSSWLLSIYTLVLSISSNSEAGTGNGRKQKFSQLAINGDIHCALSLQF